jgi:hypothetical protein
VLGFMLLVNSVSELLCCESRFKVEVGLKMRFKNLV